VNPSVVVVLLILVGVCVVAAAAITMTLLARRLKNAGPIPMDVLVDQNVPIALDQKLRIPLDAEFVIGFKERVHVEGHVPIALDLPIDTTIETSVLGIGRVKIPIKAVIPVSVVIPLSAPVTVDAANIPIRLRQDIDVRLPDFSLPLKTKLRIGIPLPTRIRRAANEEG
jgi:hypothetical protein